MKAINRFCPRWQDVRRSIMNAELQNTSILPKVGKSCRYIDGAMTFATWIWQPQELS
jgi:hypothetical protein